MICRSKIYIVYYLNRLDSILEVNKLLILYLYEIDRNAFYIEKNKHLQELKAYEEQL